MTDPKKLFIFIFLFINSFAFAQFDSLAQARVIGRMEKLRWGKHYQEIIDSCDKYLKVKKTTPWFRSKMYGFKATAKGFWIAEKQHHHTKAEESMYNYPALYKEVDSLFMLAALTYPPTKTNYFCSANDFFSGRDDYDNNRYLDSIIDYGYKPELHKISLNPEFLYGNQSYIGLEFSVFYYDRFCKVGQKINGKKRNVDVFYPYSCDLLSFGVRKSITNENWGMSVSPISGSWNWINVRPFNFTYFAARDKQVFAYCPEFGLHIGYFFFNYGYNMTFNKDYQDVETHLFSAKAQIPIFNFNKKRKSKDEYSF